MAQLVAFLVSIHVVSFPDSYILPYEPASFVWFSINHHIDQEDRQHESRWGSYQLNHIWDKFLHTTDDWYRKSVVMKASVVKPKVR